MFDDDDAKNKIENYYLQMASSPDEFPRILQPKNAEDWLLRLQADSITDHTRIHRVMIRRAQRRNLNTLLIDEHSSDFLEYISYLPEYEKMLCEDIPRRYILTNNYDAMCLKSDFGKVIIVSEVLRYFLYFMNLATLDVGDIPQDVRDNALIIAIRTMLLSEALDFDMDPRGIVPAAIEAQINHMVKWQMKFIIGHEYAHHILHHDDEEHLRMSKIRRFTDEDVGELAGYLRHHTQEFEADLHSISVAQDKSTQYSLFVGGTSFLLGLHVFEQLASEIDPSFGEINTHPQTATRVKKLIETFSSDPDFQIEGFAKVMEYYDSLSDSVISRCRKDPEIFTFYGSIYLGQWKGPVLVDRKDY